ncbi:hypothetical protein THRCLA_09844 [Thraustotheca clavata]|uniref:SET domain-containing protein n=1 Tax=Thraustotheca clavata TaxID=74557 RepID=A0A1V9YUJ4_9STRA|nr:hypothetical protein THRCLA_09844 [Thraustotheca clavata]
MFRGMQEGHICTNASVAALVRDNQVQRNEDKVPFEELMTLMEWAKQLEITGTSFGHGNVPLVKLKDLRDNMLVHIKCRLRPIRQSIGDDVNYGMLQQVLMYDGPEDGMVLNIWYQPLAFRKLQFGVKVELNYLVISFNSLRQCLTANTTSESTILYINEASSDEVLKSAPLLEFETFREASEAELTGHVIFRQVIIRHVIVPFLWNNSPDAIFHLIEKYCIYCECSLPEQPLDVLPRLYSNCINACCGKEQNAWRYRPITLEIIDSFGSVVHIRAQDSAIEALVGHVPAAQLVQATEGLNYRQMVESLLRVLPDASHTLDIQVYCTKKGNMFSFNFDNGNENAMNQQVIEAPLVKRAAKLHVDTPIQVGEDYFLPVDIDGHEMAIVNQTNPLFIQNVGALHKLLDTSDLENGVYEGGFKLWECSIDLIKYLQQHQDTIPIGAQELRVMELGCGHGLPGIYALQQGASHVLFSDYNSEVIDLATIPNAKRCAPTTIHKASFYSGDWANVSQAMSISGANMYFDVILSAETMYTEQVTTFLLEMIKRHLKPNGIALIAAKSYYFGTGGSVHHFKTLIQAQGVMKATTVWQSSDGKSNIREIIQVTFNFSLKMTSLYSSLRPLGRRCFSMHKNILSLRNIDPASPENATDKYFVRTLSPGYSSCIAAVNIKVGDVIGTTIGTVYPTPTRFTIQMSLEKHVEIFGGMQYANHHCSPNASFIMSETEPEVTLVAIKPITKGDHITFDYNTTEWDMDEKFVCNCGDAACRGHIQGAKHMHDAQILRLLPHFSSSILRSLMKDKLVQG